MPLPGWAALRLVSDISQWILGLAQFAPQGEDRVRDQATVCVVRVVALVVAVEDCELGS